MPKLIRSIVLCLSFAFLAVLLAGCLPPATNQLGPRPAPDTLGAVEAYLQKYQPGPLPRVFQTSRLYDRHGVLLAERWSDGRRTWIPLSRIPKHLIDATIATEDATFYTNPGVDPARIAGAALGNAQEGDVVSGASTITMQLARNLFMGDDERYAQSMDRKMLEAGLAQELTTLFSKDEILEMYLNLLNYGHLAYGPEAAAQVYFGKPATDLSLAEATLLAGIPQQPANLDLFTNFDAAKARQRVVLDMLVRHGFLAQTDADTIHAEPVALNPAPDQELANVTPHFAQYIWDVLDSRLGEGAAVRSGLAVTTTLDLKMQELAQGVVARKVKELKPKHDLNNAALVAMRPESGEILAMVGSADFADVTINGQVNVAVSQRQPGSAIKPVLYSTALSDDLISPATILWDVPVTYTVGNGQTYKPVNYDAKFHGPVTVRTALANSYNIPAVKLLDAVTIERMLQAAEAFGIQSLNRGKEWYGLSLTLGGGEMTLLELTSAYAALASDGKIVTPEPILAVTDALGRSVERALPQRDAPAQVVSPAAAFQVTDILSDNVARTPMFGAASPLKLSRPAAAKTGTTDDFRDNWTVGYLRPLVTGVWAGNTDGHPMKKVSGIAGAAPIWHDFMEGVLADPALRQTLGLGDDPAAWQFTPPADVEQRDECPPGATCREGGEYFSRSWLAAAGAAGPLADSVGKASSAPVFATLGENGRWTAYCRFEPAVVRPLLKLPGPLGLPGSSGAINPAESARFGLDGRHAIGWSLRHPTPVDLGTCDALAKVARDALALDPQPGDEALGITIDLSAAMDPNAGPVPGDTTLPAVAASPADFGYALARPVENNAACPGNYIFGQVLNRQGAPVAGVHIVMIDEWGNRSDAVSKNGEADYGNYDFMIHPFANHYTLTVLDPAGNIASPAVVVEHLQGAGGDAPCHTVVWIGG